MTRIRYYENIHILLWLLKDTFWLMHWRVPGIIMIFPTILLALIITTACFKKGADNEAWIHLAVLFWICGNSYWMLCEFFNREDIQYFAGFAFLAGMLSTAYYYRQESSKQ